MRIISGQWGGRRLVSFKASHIRPTTDLVKGSLFNSIQTEIEGAEVLDLFSGTGSLGLEALSRGAGAVTFVEKNP
ncbi:MAG: RsmD family RNA methyltransferase, partial [Bdellovibrio sp.]